MTWTTILNRQEGERFLAPLVEVLDTARLPPGWGGLIIRLDPLGAADLYPAQANRLSPETSAAWIPITDYGAALFGLEGANRALYIEYLSSAARDLARLAYAWNLNHISDLVEILYRLDEACERLEVDAAQFVKIWELPTAPLPPGARCATLPIWAADRHGQALVGPAAADVADLEEYMAKETQAVKNDHEE